MRGQHGRDAQAREDRIQLGVVASDAAQAGDRFGHRILEQPVARRAFATPQRPHAPASLREIDQLEVEGEGRDHPLHGAEVEAVQLRLDPGPKGRIVSPAERDGRPAESLDELEGPFAGLLLDDLAQQCTEQPHLDGQGIARAGRADAGGLRAVCRRPRSRAPFAHAALRAGRFRNLGRTPSQPFVTATFPTLVR
jgi:hypothetical protein